MPLTRSLRLIQTNATLLPSTWPTKVTYRRLVATTRTSCHSITACPVEPPHLKRSRSHHFLGRAAIGGRRKSRKEKRGQDRPVNRSGDGGVPPDRAWAKNPRAVPCASRLNRTSVVIGQPRKGTREDTRGGAATSDSPRRQLLNRFASYFLHHVVLTTSGQHCQPWPRSGVLL